MSHDPFVNSTPKDNSYFTESECSQHLMVSFEMLTDYLHTVFLLMCTIVFGEKAVEAGRSRAHVMVDSVAASSIIFILYAQYRLGNTKWKWFQANNQYRI